MRETVANRQSDGPDPGGVLGGGAAGDRVSVRGAHMTHMLAAFDQVAPQGEAVVKPPEHSASPS